MKDMGTLVPDTGAMALAEIAVRYLLQRLRHDADLRHHLLHTEALHKLLLADSLRTGAPAKDMAEAIAQAARQQEPALLVQCRRALKSIYDIAADALSRGADKGTEALQEIQELTESHRD